MKKKSIYQEIDRIAELARLELSDEDKKRLVVQLDRILQFMERLDELKLNSADEVDFVQQRATPLRKDEAKPGLSPEEALKNASLKHGHFFVVPRVVKKENRD